MTVHIGLQGAGIAPAPGSPRLVFAGHGFHLNELPGRAPQALAPGAIASATSDWLRAEDHPDAIAIGLLPFVTGTAWLFPAVAATPAGGLTGLAAPCPAGPFQVVSRPAREDYRARVARVTEAMRADPELRKVVLARSLYLEAPGAIDVGAVLRELGRDPAVTTFCLPLPDREDAVFLGATPELLIAKEGRRITSRPLAGSARRGSDPAATAADAADLLNSAKDQKEHALVVEAMLDTLAPFCRQLRARPAAVFATRTMLHLGSSIEGELADAATPVAELAVALHPTPAVCGVPPDRARQVIAAMEGFDRRYFCGAVGWSDSAGDGRWYVAIRCAEISSRSAILFAGAGIVPDSDPAAEAAETSAKFATLLSALGIDEAGQPRGDHG